MDLCSHQIALWVYNKDVTEVNWLNSFQKFWNNNFHGDSSLVEFGVQQKIYFMNNKDSISFFSQKPKPTSAEIKPQVAHTSTGNTNTPDCPLLANWIPWTKNNS